MSDINYFQMLFICLFTLVIWILFVYKGMPRTVLFPISLLTISYFIYCGIGLTWVNGAAAYIHKYCIYYFTLIFTLTLVICYNKGSIIIGNSTNLNKQSIIINDKLHEYKGIYCICTVVLFLCYICYLIVPEFRLEELIIPPFPSLPRKLALVSVYNQLSLFSLIDMLITFLVPFMLLLMQVLIDENKKVKALLLLLFWIYLDYIKFSYLGRNEIVRYAILIFVMMIYQKQFKKKRVFKYILIGGMLLIVVFPFLMEYTAIRQGGTAQSMGILDAINSLIETETYYPQYYDTIVKVNKPISIVAFILWLIFIPIPSIIWPNKPTVLINDIFTTYVLGTHRGEVGFSVELPSILGEAMFIFGETFYFVHAIIIGIIVSIMLRFYKKYPSMWMIYMYFSVLLLVAGRGGSGSFIPNIINGSISVIFWLWLIKHMKLKQDDSHKKYEI